MTSPTIAGTQFFSTTSNTDGWLKKASIVTARVTFSEAVFVTGKPLLNLMVGSTPVQAKYFSGSSTANRSSSELLFTFTVGANMFDADGLSLASTSLSLPTGTAIKNSLAEMAELSVLNPQPVAGLKVDSTLAVVSINGDDATRFGTTIKKGAAQSLGFSVSEAGTAYLLSSKLPFTGFAKATAAQKKSLSIDGTQASNALSLVGLAPDVYKLYFVDAAGNLTTLTKTITVDNVAPKLLAAPSISGATGLEKSTLGAGDVVTFAAKFSEEVVVSGVPTLAFTVGTQTLYANFSNTSTVSGKSTVFFTHTLDPLLPLRDANGISIGANAIALNGGSISDYAGNSATLTHALVKDNAGYKVDSVANQLVSIGIDGWTPGTAVLKDAGQTITFKAVFGEQVSVLGTPKLNVNVGGTVLQATAVASTAASSEVKFVLTLPLNVSDSDGISLGANPIEMTSTNNIYSPVSGNFSVVTFAGAQFETYKVNAMAASISEIGFSNSRTDSPSVLKLGDVVTATVKFSEAVVVSNKSALMLKIGELDAKAAYLSGSNSDTIKFTYTIAEGVQSTVGIKLADAPLTGMTGTSAVKDAGGFNANLAFNFAGVPAYMPVDAKSVVINAINISSANAVNGCVGIGAQITAVVNFSEAVEVTGAPTLKLKLDAATPVVATYTGGNNTNALTFVYTVSAGDTALTGVGTPSAPLTLNGAVLKDAAGNLLKTAFAPAVSTTKVDTTGPVATLVSYKGDTGGSIKTLKAGDVIAFELTYPEAVTVTGEPSIGVQIGSNLRQALCTGQNVSRTVLKFSYTVQAGDADTDGIALGAGVLTLNAGSITDAYGNPASLSHPGASFVAPLKVDTTAPDVPVLSITEGAQNGVTYSEVVAGTPVYQVSATGATKLEVTLTNAQGVSVTVLHTSNLAAQSYQLTQQDMQTLGAGQINVSATALDAVGNRSQAVTGSFNMDLAQVAITQVALVGGKASGFYKAGDIVIASLTFSEAVVLKTTPQTKPTVTLMVGATEVQASYAGGSNSSTLRFAYTVGADHADEDGIGLLQNSLQLNGSTLASLSGVTPVFAHASIVNNPEFKIDNVAPNLLTVQLAQDTGSSDVDLVTNKRAVTVGGQETDGTWQYSTNAGTTWLEGTGTSFLLAVKSHAADAIRVRQTDRAGNVGEATVLAGPVVVDTSAGNITTIVFSGATGAQNTFLNAGDVLTAMVSFSELVDVTGQPKLALVVGSTAVQANYANGSGTPEIYFTYTVAADMTDADGIHVPVNALSLNGATLKDRAGNVMQITSALGSADTNYRVDTTKPAVLVLNVDVAGQFSESQAFTLNSQAGISGLESNATWQFSTNAGVSWSAGSGQTFVIPDGSYAAGAILIRQLDAAGNASDATAFPRALVVDTEVVAPTLTLSTDAGGLGTDGVSNLGSVAVGALEAGAAWQYSTNSGASWTTGTGSSFTLAAGTYAADAIQVKQTDLVGNVSVAGKYVSAIVIDQTAATISSLSITSATGVQNSRLNAGDVVTVAVVFSELVDVTGAPTLGITVGASAVNATYASGSGSNTLNFVYTIQAGQTDADGINVSANAITLNGGSINDRAGNATTITNTVGSANGSYMVDTTAPSAPTLQITDTGSSPSDGITNNATVTVNGLEAGSTWQYSTNSGSTWTTGTGSSFTLAAGTYAANAVQIRQTDAAGNLGTAGSNAGAITVDATAATISSLSITSATGVQNSRLNAGDVVTAVVVFSELVDVTGAPTLGITVGASAVNATYASGSGSNTLNFVYTIQAGQTDADGINVTANAITLNGGSINDRAGNATSLGSTIGSANASYMVDTTVPAHSGLTTASTTENVSTLTTVYTAQASDAASSVTYSLSGADAAKFSINTTSGAVNFISSPNFEAPTDTGANNIYDINVVATDLAGNAAARAVAITVTDILNAGEYTSPAGESVIDLGSYGKLIAPVQVEGNWYYYWDLSGDGSNTNTGLLNSGSDRTTHDFLDGIFRYASDFKTLDTDNDTDNIYRYAVLNGIRLALPTVGHSSGGVKVGTYVGTPSEANNEYDDLIAIWDAHNGIEPISSYTPPLNLYINGTPSGWTSSIYLAATRGGVANYHGNVRLNTGAIDFYADVSADQSGYVALQVLSSTPPLVLANDTGRSSTDNISTNGLVNVPDLITGNAWQYTIDSGTSWLNGTGISFTLAAGNYAANAVQVRQTTPEGVTTVTARNSISFVVDATVPTVSSVAITAATGSLDSILNVGDVVTAVVVFSELVDVTGAPTLGITVGASAVNATYASGSGSNTLNFVYTIQAGQTDADGINVSANAITLNGGSINDRAGNAATITNTVGSANGSYMVDTTAPSAPTLQITDTGSSPSDGITNNATVTVNGLEAGSTWQYSTNSGSTWTTGTGSSFTLAAGTYAANAVQIRQTDAAGNLGTAGSNAGAITVDATAATISSLSITSATGVQNSRLNAGDVVTAVVVFSELVDVTGAPTLGITVGASAVNATYASGSGSNTLNFVYTIQAGQTDADGINVTANAITLNGGSINDRAGNATSLGSTIGSANASYMVDTTVPAHSGLTTASTTENVSTLTTVYTAQASDAASSVTYSLSGADAAKFSINTTSGAVNFISSPNFEAPTDTGANNIYDINVVATDLAGNAAARAVAITVTDILNAGEYTSPAGESVIDLGSYGKLIAPVQVEGNWYYYWDLSGDGSNTNTGLLNSGSDRTTHDFLDGIFRYASDFKTLDTDNDTDNIYRYAVLNGIRLALPTVGHSSGGVKVGTYVGTPSEANNEYDDLIAIWDAHNGIEPISSYTPPLNLYINGTPSGWTSSIYLAATRGGVANYHGNVRLNTGAIDFYADVSADQSGYVALQVLSSTPPLVLANDTGRSSTDNISTNGLVNVPDLITGNAWQYTIDSGTSWLNGTGISFTLAAGNYAANAVQVRQTTPEGVTTVTARNSISFVVDATVPTVSSVAITAATGSLDSILNVGDVVTAVVVFSELVDVTGAPTLGITVGASAVNATYASGSGSNTLNFVYTIQAGQTDADGINVSANAITLNGGSINDRAGNAATITNTVGSANGSYMVDTTAPSAPTLQITDTGSSPSDGITNNATVTVNGLEAGSTWQYSTNSGSTWTTGTGSSFTLAAGTYAANAVQIRQTDAAGNLGTAGSNAGAITVDATAATISSLSITSATGVQNSRLNAGDVVTVAAVFSELVDVTGAPTLGITVGASAVNATYASGSGSNTLNFVYTIQEGQTDADGINVNVNAIVLNSGSINDRAGNVATITNTVGSANGSYMVDTTAATVSTVAIVGAAGLQGSLLNIGDVVTASVTFSEKVMVTGTPQLGLNIGDTVVQGNYLSGKGSNTLLFTYTVASGLTDANGVSINANALALNAGTITDVSGTAAVITHAAVLDNAAYAVENTEAPGAPTLALGSGYSYAVDATSGAGLSNLVSVTGTTGLTLNVKFTSSTGGTVTKTLTATGAAQTVSLTNAELLTLKDGVISASAWTTNASGKNSLTTTLGNGLAADLPASLSLGTVSGVNLNLVSKVTLGNGKVYYLLDQNGDGLYDVRDKSLNHNSLDTLLNGGADTVDTQLRGAVAGVDDARTLVQGGYTLVLPTANEWNNFNDAVLGATFPVPGWSQEFYFTASKMGAELHNPAMLDSNVVHVAWGWNEDWAYTHNLAFEVLSNGSFKLDVTPRSFTSPTSVSVAENTATSTAAYTPVASDEGTLYYEISGSDASLFTVNSTTGAVVFKGRPDFENRLDANQDGVYSINIVTTDSVGTVVTSPVDITVTDVAETATAYTVGQAVIDLGGYGKLIAPVTVEGKTYYYWDRSGDGVARNGTGTENESVDYTDHQTLDRIFKYSSDFTTTNPAGFGADTTNTYRYATLNGVKLALPTYGGPVDANGKSASTTSRAGTAVADGTTENGTYDDLLAIWDAFNGSGTTTNASGIPSGWLGGDVFYQSATNASADSHQRINLNSGLTAPLSNTIDGYVVLQVLA